MIRFRVEGIPGPGGSKSAFYNARLGRSVLVDCGGKRTRDWRAAVRFACIDAMDGEKPLRGPVRFTFEFVMPRPGKHHRKNRKTEPLRDDAPVWHLQAPDLTKLVRSTEDALKGIAWIDDSQVVEQTVVKRWARFGEEAGALVEIGPVLIPGHDVPAGGPIGP